MKQSDDQTLFALELESESTRNRGCGPLSSSPTQFRNCSQLLSIPDSGTPAPYSMTNKGLRITLPIVLLNDTHHLAILHCTSEARYPARVTLPLITEHPNRQFARDPNNCGQFTRDRRHIGPLGYSRPDSLLRARADTIFLG
jgi:hypothetical protein